jgi:hypothetical protein
MKTTTAACFYGLALTGLITCGCAQEEEFGTEVPVQTVGGAGSNSEPPTPEAGVAAEGDASEAQETVSRDFDGLRLSIPTSWEEAELTAMQRSVLLAKFKMPSLHEDIELTVSSAGGGIEANFGRWEGQFSDSQKEEDTLSAGSTDAQLIRLTGDFHPGFGRPDQEGWTMVGVAIASASGDFYLKLTGPADHIKQAEQQLRTAVKSSELIQ